LHKPLGCGHHGCEQKVAADLTNCTPISSMKTIVGCTFSARVKSAATSLGVSPYHLSVSVAMFRLMKVQSAVQHGCYVVEQGSIPIYPPPPPPPDFLVRERSNHTLVNAWHMRRSQRCRHFNSNRHTTIEKALLRPPPRISKRKSRNPKCDSFTFQQAARMKVIHAARRVCCVYSPTHRFPLRWPSLAASCRTRASRTTVALPMTRTNGAALQTGNTIQSCVQTRAQGMSTMLSTSEKANGAVLSAP
jgi:hypothetical protein